MTKGCEPSRVNEGSWKGVSQEEIAVVKDEVKL